MSYITLRLISTTLISVALTACGGSGSTSSSTKFNVAEALATVTTSGLNRDFSIVQNGKYACSGNGNKTKSPATSETTFRVTPSTTVAALSSVETLTLNGTNCTFISNELETTVTTYVNPNNFLPLGHNSVGNNYGSYLTAPSYPASVSVGDAGITGTENLYTDSTELTSNGRVDGSYVVTADTPSIYVAKADTPSSAIITFIHKKYNATNTWISTEQDAWRISTAGGFMPISMNIQYADGYNITFIYNNTVQPIIY